ncbi:MAG: molybdopterin-guanine dinucleotide biosynthesis protein B [Rhodospirillales bacterium]|nr:molybdopterin-guanine dinucleotide biosynthesis protein B [Rhodospirillales bacterium]
MKIFGLAGWSGSGKTTLMVGLLPLLVRHGLRVSTMKHAHHEFDVDRPGKDSYRHREAGATEVMISSAKRFALMHELRDTPEPSVEELVKQMAPVDLLMIEGFKQHAHDKLEIYRPSVGKPMLCLEDRRVVAIATDEPVASLALLDRPVPRLDLNDVEGIAQFVLRHCGFAPQKRHGAA